MKQWFAGYSMGIAKGLIVILFFVGLGKVEGQWNPLGGTNDTTFNNIVDKLTTDANGNVYASGGFTNDSGKFYVAKWNGSTWSEVGGRNTSIFNSYISSLVTDVSGNIYAVGNLKNSNGNNYVAKWNGSVWSELGGTNTSTFNSFINTLAIDASGNIYAGGTFKNGIGNYYIAKWNGSNWSEVGGTNSSTFNGVFLPYGFVALTIDNNGNLYAGGAVENNKGNLYIAKWNDTAWSEIGKDTALFNDVITNIVTDKSGNVYACGMFGNAHGHYIAKWNGTVWSELGGKNVFPSNAVIRSIKFDLNGNLYAGGDFTNSDGKWYVAKWNGNVWKELVGDSNSLINWIYGVTTDVNGNVYAGGWIKNNIGKYYVAKYNPTTTPITLTTFTARPTETNQIKTEWQTATEVNSSHFIVEQSSDGKTFTAKGTVKAVGSGANRYAFDVPSSSPSGDRGVLYFRLKMIDKDGSYEYSKVVSVTLTTNHSPLITITPNPAHNTTTVSIHLPKAQTIQYQLINTEGKPCGSVQKQALPAGKSSFPVSLNGLVKGIYWLKIEGIGKQQLVVE